MAYISLSKHETAVSPVVGVMLMLVVTIIIAAVVSAFAGGLASGSKAAPQASIVAKAFVVNYANNMTSDNTGNPASDIYVLFENRGGEGINLNNIQIQIADSGYPNQAATISNSILPNKSASIIGDKNSTHMSAFSKGWTYYLEGYPDHSFVISPGSQFVMHADASSDRYVAYYSTNSPTSPAAHPAIYWINNNALSSSDTAPVYAGDYLIYKIIDKDSGKSISSGQIVIPIFTDNHDTS